MRKLLSSFTVLFLLLFAFQTVQSKGLQTDKSSEFSSSDSSDRIAALVQHFESQNLDLKSLIEDPRFELYDSIGNRFRNSAERRTPTLEEYKRILGYQDKLNRIPGFIETHLESMEEAERTYDIPRHVIAAIIGVESDFGRNVGSFNPLRVYVSMYNEDYRADFARAQLEELVKFTERKGIDVFELKSSYAGAMSFAQFIPYSINRWWVGDDIFSMHNNILSVANYLAHFKNITGTIEGAVFRYNPSSLYRDAVISLAEDAAKL
ncbi:MAG: lytic murein transglycosylase [Balneolaceae bacterium]|nr:lytic murein transglycosylase [Balneolaceae bacterium]